MQEIPHGRTLGAIVAADYRAAGVFDRFGLDFCCGGKQTLQEACARKAIAPTAVMAALESLGEADGAAAHSRVPDMTWTVTRLVRFIVDTHHVYVRRQLPIIAERLQKLVRAHGGQHPELSAVASHFAQLAAELELHLRKEEQILFPFVCSLDAAVAGHGALPLDLFGTVMNPIRVMEADHENAGDELAVIRLLTADFTPPVDGCATYRICFEELRAFDRDLRAHIHAENNILFRKALDLEGAVHGRTTAV
jgi:regulator of cell morphogenesis and NO signaling